MVGVSLTIALFLVLERKSSLLKCFAVLLLGFFSVTRNSHAEILPVFPGEILPLQGKRLEQNRITSYDAPPNRPVFGIYGKFTENLRIFHGLSIAPCGKVCYEG